jgi:hypothetical protein
MTRPGSSTQKPWQGSFTERLRKSELSICPDWLEGEDVVQFIERAGAEAKGRLIEEVAGAAVWAPQRFITACKTFATCRTTTMCRSLQTAFSHITHIMIAGESGVGKSLLRLELALHIAMGWDWQGFKIPRARSVAIFQFENSEHTEKFRIKKMLEGLGTTIQAVGDRIRYAKRDERYNLS